MCLAYCPPSFLKYIVSRSTLDLIPELCIPHSAFIPHSFPPVAPLLRHCRRAFGVIIASGGYGTRTPVPVRRKEGRRKPLHLGRCGCTKNMYIELFLLDNFLMNLLTLRAAAAMLSRKMKGSRAALVSFAGAAAAASWARPVEAAKTTASIITKVTDIRLNDMFSLLAKLLCFFLAQDEARQRQGRAGCKQLHRFVGRHIMNYTQIRRRRQPLRREKSRLRANFPVTSSVRGRRQGGR